MPRSESLCAADNTKDPFFESESIVVGDRVTHALVHSYLHAFSRSKSKQHIIYSTVLQKDIKTRSTGRQPKEKPKKRRRRRRRRKIQANTEHHRCNILGRRFATPREPRGKRSSSAAFGYSIDSSSVFALCVCEKGFICGSAYPFVYSDNWVATCHGWASIQGAHHPGAILITMR